MAVPSHQLSRPDLSLKSSGIPEYSTDSFFFFFFLFLQFSDYQNYLVNSCVKENPTMERSIALCNGISQWVQLMVLSRPTPQLRAEVFIKFIQVAQVNHWFETFGLGYEVHLLSPFPPAQPIRAVFFPPEPWWGVGRFVCLQPHLDLVICLFFHTRTVWRGRGHTGHIRGQDPVWDLFRSLTFFKRCLPAYVIFPSLAHMAKERAVPRFTGAGPA